MKAEFMREMEQMDEGNTGTNKEKFKTDCHFVGWWLIGQMFQPNIYYLKLYFKLITIVMIDQFEGMNIVTKDSWFQQQLMKYLN